MPLSVMLSMGSPSHVIFRHILPCIKVEREIAAWPGLTTVYYCLLCSHHPPPYTYTYLPVPPHSASVVFISVQQTYSTCCTTVISPLSRNIGIKPVIQRNQEATCESVHTTLLPGHNHQLSFTHTSQIHFKVNMTSLSISRLL